MKNSLEKTFLIFKTKLSRKSFRHLNGMPKNGKKHIVEKDKSSNNNINNNLILLDVSLYLPIHNSIIPLIISDFVPTVK
jgi:hypothetical protein